MNGAENLDDRRQPGAAGSREEERMSMTDPDLHDSDLLDEIELYGELVIAASASDGPLSIDRIDEVLGIDQPESPTPG